MKNVGMVKILRRGLLVLLASLPLLASAVPSAQQVVQHTIDQLLSDLKANKAAYQADPKTFYAALDRTLGPVVDADGISRSIMTVKYSRRATPEQMQRFEDNFKLSLMQFYGNALLEYDNQEILVLPARIDGAERASVGMEFKDSKGTIYPVAYTMVKVDGQWKLRNLVVNGINIGKLFRDQFTEAMRRNGQNLDKTIDGWAEVVSKAKVSTDNQQASGT
jgi:phospholipid transport system substrate-binding protein